MRIRIWHIIVFALMLAVFAAASAPAALVAPQREGVFTYQRAQGSIWNARFYGARVGPYAAGEVSWRVSALGLLRGAWIVNAAAAGGEMDGAAELETSLFGGGRVLRIPALTLSGAPIGQGLVSPGETKLSDVEIAFANGTCARARGNAETDVLARAAPVLNWQGPALTGAPSCADVVALLPLSGVNAAGEQVDVRFELKPDGSGTWRAVVNSAKPETIAALANAGYAGDAATGAISSGEFRWSP